MISLLGLIILLYIYNIFCIFVYLILPDINILNILLILLRIRIVSCYEGYTIVFTFYEMFYCMFNNLHIYHLIILINKKRKDNIDCYILRLCIKIGIFLTNSLCSYLA